MSKFPTRPVILAGYPDHNPWLFRVVPFPSGDATVFIHLPKDGSWVLLRDIEMERAKAARLADHIHSPRDFAPTQGLSGDRDEATAQAAAELLVRKGVKEIWADRSMPMLYAHFLGERGVKVHCDPAFGVLERRAKSPREVDALRAAQSQTERATRYACERIASARAAKDGALALDGAPLTSERMNADIKIFLLQNGMTAPDSIVAGGAIGADCHHRGAGALRTREPIIVDIFPSDPRSRYFGDCTRSVVHGPASEIPAPVRDMHAAVVEAKRAAIAATRAGVTGEQVHKAACAVFSKRGYGIGLPTQPGKPSYAHGTGHGVGLDVHEPPLLADGGPALVVGDCLTIEPGLYAIGVGGIRVEDMVIVTDKGCDNLNSLPESLTWA